MHFLQYGAAYLQKCALSTIACLAGGLHDESGPLAVSPEVLLMQELWRSPDGTYVLACRDWKDGHPASYGLFRANGEVLLAGAPAEALVLPLTGKPADTSWHPELLKAR